VITESWLGIVLFAVTAARAADSIPPLDIKPGLWEVTLTIQTSGPAPSEVLTPERAGNQANARQPAVEGPRITVNSTCLEDQDLPQSLMFALGSEKQGCRETVVANASRSKREIHLDCGAGLSQRRGTYRIEAVDPQNMQISANWSAADGSHTISTATLRWLGALCDFDFPGTPKVAPPAAKAPPAAGIHATSDAAYYYKLGREQADRNEFWEALRSLNRAIELDPQRATSYNARGYVYLRLKTFANAELEFSDAIRLRPDYANAYRNRAIARRYSGDKEGAEADNRKAEELENRH
jgi:Flp pilus assembly protein TadD